MTENFDISRVTRTRAQAQAAYDRISKWYDLLEGRWERKLKDVGLQKLGIREGEIVLEVGFGTGHGILALARSVGATGRVYGIDLSAKMIEITRESVRKKGLEDRVELIQGDALQLPFETDFFDAAFMSFVLELFDTPEIPRVLHECLRVLQVGGRICVVSLSKMGGPSRMRRLYEWGHRVFPRILDCRPIYVERALREAGFAVSDATIGSVAGLPVEVVLATKPGQ